MPNVFDDIEELRSRLGSAVEAIWQIEHTVEILTQQVKELTIETENFKKTIKERNVST